MENICDFQITQNGIKYVINLAIIDNYLEINCYEYKTNKNNEFSAQYSHEQIKQFSPLFSSTKSIYEDFIMFKNAVESQKVRINRDEKNEIYITFILEEEQNENVDIPLHNSYIEFFPVRRLPTIHVKMKTINIRRPTIYINGDENEISQNYINNNLSYQPKIVQQMPIINNSNIIHNKTFTQANPNKYNYLSPQKRRKNLSYYSPVNSPDREKIEFINYGSPSKNQFNYTSYKRNINSPLKNNSLQMNNITSLSNYSTEECDDKIKILQDELNKSRKNLEQYKTNINKLENIINNLHSKNEQLSNENEKMKNILQNKNSEIDVDLLQKQFEDEKNKLQNEFELYKKQKEEEINLFNSKIEQLMNQINIYQNENQELKIKVEQISKSIYERRNKYRIVRGDIIQDNKELEFLTQRICDKHKKITLNLLYKATVDSDKAQVFHLKCDSAPSSLVLIKSSKNKRFGGFTSCSWAGKDKEKPDENAFVFSLDKMEIYNVIPEENAIGCYPKYGPIFLGCQIRIYDNAFENGGSTFEKGLNYDTPEDYVLTGGEQKFGVEEIEVYGVEIE
jgi:prefoldin subunit 5